MLLAFVKNGEAPDWTSLTLANFARFFTAASYQRALWNSVYSGLAATLLATAIALPMAYAVARIEMPLPRAHLGDDRRAADLAAFHRRVRVDHPAGQQRHRSRNGCTD